MVTSSIWRDIYYTGNESALSYYIKVDSQDGNTIFNGKAYALPDSNIVSINISKLCADYLSNELTTLDNGTYVNPMASRYFYLFNGNGSLLETYLFSYDWSYEVSPASITPRYGIGQKVVTTTKGTTAYTNTISTYDSSSLYCGRFALIYLEPCGKWNSFLMEGRYRVSDTFNTYTTDRVYNNNTVEFGTNKYINQISTSYELSTGWLSDRDSELFAKNILRSIKVYLQDIEKNTVIPVVIMDSNVERKQYRNEKELISYTITVEESQNKEIR